MPDLLFRLKPDGSPVFADFAAQIERTEFAPGVFHGSGTMTPMDYLVALTDGLIPAPENLDVATVQQQILANGFRYHISQYLSRRANDWAAVGQHESLRDWRSLSARFAADRGAWAIAASAALVSRSIVAAEAAISAVRRSLVAAAVFAA